jgi:phage terminase small subunit
MNKQLKPGEQPRIPVHQRRTRFIKEYLIDKNATRAAIAAGYGEKGASVAATRLLKDVKIRAAIESANKRINDKLDITVERVKLELARLAFFDPLEFWNADGTAKPLHEISEDARRAISGLEVAELFAGAGEERNLAGYIKKFKLADKGANLERLGKHLQMFPTKVEIDHRLEIQRIDDGSLDERIAGVLRDLGLAAEIDATGNFAVTPAREETSLGEAKDSALLSR